MVEDVLYDAQGRKQQVLCIVWNVQFPHLFLAVLKNRPDWMKGKYNGPGGKVRVGEDVFKAARREFREECTLDIVEDRWRHFCTITGTGWQVHCLTVGLDHTEFFAVKAGTDEPIISTSFLRLQGRGDKYLMNLQWLLPLAQDKTVTGVTQVQDSHP